MANTKISEYSNIPANNTEIDGINIAEGCAPSGINNAIRELMAQLKDFQTGAAGDSLTVGGTLSVTGAVNLTSVLTVANGGTGLSAAAAGDILYGSGVNTYARLASANTTTSVLLSGSTAPSWGKVGLTTHVTGTLPIANGGTGATSASAAINALLPSQTGQANKILQTNGTNVSWATVAAGSSGTVTSVTAGDGLSGGTITTTGTISMGTPGSLSATSTNSASGSTHTHAVTFPVTSVKGASSDSQSGTGNVLLSGLDSFANTKSGNGMQKLPGGVMMQWGNVDVVSGGIASISFLSGFTAVYSVQLTAYRSGSTDGVGNDTVLAGTLSTSGVSVSSANGNKVYWFAIGTY
jgi:hypothetical protein